MYLCAGQDLLAKLLLDLMQLCIIVVHLHLDYSWGPLAQSIKQVWKIVSNWIPGRWRDED